jgi:hypothetical protein
MTNHSPGRQVLSAKVAYVQLAAMSQEIAGANPVGVDQPSSAVRMVWLRRGDTDVAAVWTVRGTADVGFRIASGYLADPFGYLADPFGNRTGRKGLVTIHATESPVFLVGKGITRRC